MGSLGEKQMTKKKMIKVAVETVQKKDYKFLDAICLASIFSYRSQPPVE